MWHLLQWWVTLPIVAENIFLAMIGVFNLLNLPRKCLYFQTLCITPTTPRKHIFTPKKNVVPLKILPIVVYGLHVSFQVRRVTQLMVGSRNSKTVDCLAILSMRKCHNGYPCTHTRIHTNLYEGTNAHKQTRALVYTLISRRKF